MFIYLNRGLQAKTDFQTICDSIAGDLEVSAKNPEQIEEEQKG